MNVIIEINVEVTKEVFDGIMKAKEILGYGLVPKHTPNVNRSLRKLGHDEAADWIEENRDTFEYFNEHVCRVRFVR